MSAHRLPYLRSAAWLGFEAVCVAAISLASTLVTASIIGQAAVGLAAVALGIIQLINFPIEALFHDTLVQRHRVTRPHLAAAFWIVLPLGILLSLATLGLAPTIALIYGQPQLEHLLQVSSLAFVFSALASIQAARLRRALRFRTLAVCTVASRTAGALLGVVLALRGYGAASLIWQYVTPIVLLSCFINVGCRLPRWHDLSHRRIRDLLPFALVQTASELVTAGRSRLFFALIGYYLPLDLIGQLSIAFRMVESLTAVMTTTVSRFCLPLFARSQRDPAQLRANFRSAFRLVALATLPPFAGLTVCAGDVVAVLFDATWQPVAQLVQILGIGAMAFFLQAPFASLMTSIGRPTIILAMSAFSAALTAAAILILAPGSATAAVVIWAVPFFVTVPASFVIIRRFLHESVRSQVAGVLPVLSIAAAVALLLPEVRALLLAPTASVVKIVAADVLIGASIYLLLAGAYFLAVGRRLPAIGMPHLAGSR